MTIQTGKQGLNHADLVYGYAGAFDTGDQGLIQVQDRAIAISNPDLLERDLQELVLLDIETIDAQDLLRAIDVANLAKGTALEIYFEACLIDIFNARPELVNDVIVLAPELQDYFHARRKDAMIVIPETIEKFNKGSIDLAEARVAIDSIVRSSAYDRPLIEAIGLVTEGTPLEVSVKPSSEIKDSVT